MNFFEVFILSIKSFLWLVVTIFCGLLLPIGLVWLDSSLTTRYFSFNDFLKNGTLMFFAMAVVASISLDYLLSKHILFKWKKSTVWLLFDLFLFLVFPFFLFLCCITLFFIPYKGAVEEIDFEKLRQIEYYILSIVFIYGFIVKFNAFKN